MNTEQGPFIPGSMRLPDVETAAAAVFAVRSGGGDFNSLADEADKESIRASVREVYAAIRAHTGCDS